MITREDIRRIAYRHDVPFSWPDETCVEPVHDLIEHARGHKIERDPIFDEPSEHHASVHIMHEYGGSWGRVGIDYLTRNNYGVEIDKNGPFETGDILELSNCKIAVFYKLPESFIGIYYADNYVYVRGTVNILPIPLRCCDVVSAARITSCPR